MDNKYNQFISMHPLIPTNTLKSKKRNSKSSVDIYQPRNILIVKLIAKYYYDLLEVLTYNYVEKCIKEDKEIDITIHI